MILDDIDRKLIALLRTDARLPISSLAASLSVSRGTIQNRIDKLMATKAIMGFTVRLKPDMGTDTVRAIMLIEIQGKKSRSVQSALFGFPEVLRLHSTNGHWDLVVELETETLTGFDKVLNDIRMIDGIANSQTNLLLTTIK